jgi:rubrerythrin
MTTHDTAPASTPPTAPVDDRTYNLLQALTSTLEALDAYEVYAQDDSNGIFVELIDDERRHAERLLGELRSCLLVADR